MAKKVQCSVCESFIDIETGEAYFKKGSKGQEIEELKSKIAELEEKLTPKKVESKDETDEW